MADETEESPGNSSSEESADLDFHGIKHTVFQENMAAVEKELELLEKGTHKEYLQDVMRLEQEKDDRIRQAELFKSFRKDCINRWLQEDIEEIARQLDKEKEDVQQNMMEELKDRKRRLDEERNNNDLVEETRSTGWRKSVRSKRGDAAQKAPAQPERGNKRKKVQPPTGPKINFKLKDSEISEDVLLVSTRQARGEKSRSAGRRA